MSPLEHYRVAEKLLEGMEKVDLYNLPSTARWPYLFKLDMAQVHATLATVEAHTSMAWGKEKT